jgi:hypothetical protein
MLSTSSDIRQGDALLQLAPDGAEAIFGDKGYDSDVFYSSHLRERVFRSVTAVLYGVTVIGFTKIVLFGLNACSVKSNITGACFHDLTSPPEMCGLYSLRFCTHLATMKYQQNLRLRNNRKFIDYHNLFYLLLHIPLFSWLFPL